MKRRKTFAGLAVATLLASIATALGALPAAGQQQQQNVVRCPAGDYRILFRPDAAEPEAGLYAGKGKKYPESKLIAHVSVAASRSGGSVRGVKPCRLDKTATAAGTEPVPKSMKTLTSATTLTCKLDKKVVALAGELNPSRGGSTASLHLLQSGKLSADATVGLGGGSQLRFDPRVCKPGPLPSS